jgi:Mrp family chromosome partitioning ATPase
MAKAIREARMTFVRLRASAVLVLFAMIVTMLAALLHAIHNPEYTASSRLLLGPALPPAALEPVGQARADPNPMAASFQLSAEAEAAIVPSALVATRVARALKLTTPPEELADFVTASPLSDAIVEVQASSPDPRLAAKLANGFADQYVTYRRESTGRIVAELMQELDTRSEEIRVGIGRLDSTFEPLAGADTSRALEEEAAQQALQSERERLLAAMRSLDLQATNLRAAGSAQARGGAVISRAAVPKGEPRTVQAVALGVFVGGAIGASLAALRGHPGLVGAPRAGVDAVMGMPVLANVPVARRRRLGGSWRSRPPLLHGAESAAWASYGRLTGTLVARGLGTTLRKVVVVATVRGEETRSVATNLAAACADAGLPTVVLSADTLSAGLGVSFGLENSPERRSQVADDNSWIGAAASIQPYLMVLPMALQASRTPEILHEAAGVMSVVVVEVPPLTESAAAIVIGEHCDVVLLVEPAGSARGEAVENAGWALSSLDRPLQGVVLIDPSSAAALR